MANLLCIPIVLDVLYLPTPRAVVEAHADFSRLPYIAKDGAGKPICDINPDTPYLSEEILSEPLQDESLYLQAGVHLHWALPDALTRALQVKGSRGVGKMKWAKVPNRWLVTRSHNGTPDQQWIVESDFLYPEGSSSLNESITFPVTPTVGKSQPYRYMGRQLKLADWLTSLTSQPSPEYLPRLTAVGYGDPNFAAFYPNCHSVFGFHDPAPGSVQGLQYDVIGWYASPNDDFMNPVNSFWLRQAFASFCVQHGLTKPNPHKKGSYKPNFNLLNPGKKYKALEKEFGWKVVDAPPKRFPKSLVCYASLVFAPAESSDTQKAIKIAVGNTGAEALSAYLAATLRDADKSVFEDQLEALLIQSEGQNHQLDWSFKFSQARHEKGFTPFSGGTMWSIRPGIRGSSAVSKSDEQVSLPDNLAHLLNRLNQQQQTLDRIADEVDDLRRLLYADWCKYQRCSYPPEDSRASYPQPDEVRYFIQQTDMKSLKGKLAQMQIYALQCAQTTQILNIELQSFNQNIQKAHANSPAYQLQPIPGQRYWRANDPVLLLAGPGIQPTARHGEDGTLACQVIDLPIPPKSAADIAKLSILFKDIKPAVWTEQPWNPYMMEWEVEVLPIEEGSNLDPNYYAYVPNYIGDNFELQVKQVDLTVYPQKAMVTRGANIYSGRSLLTPQAGQNLSATLKAWVEQQSAKNDNERDPIYKNVQAVYTQLQSGGEYYQSQSLGGFHEALLMQQQTYQLHLKDPLAFSDHQPFAKKVAELVKDGNRTAPQPLNDFNPIRTGIMRLLNLRLVDTFGQTRTLVQDANLDQLICADTLSTSDQPNWVFLPPRLAQPARLDFYWLSANDGNVQMNSHPATSPVCGWLMPNNLDGTLMVYDQGGSILGWIEKTDNAVAWQPAPGATQAVFPDTISNPHLQKVVCHILEQNKTVESNGLFYLDHFLAALGSALENIDPANFAQHESLALLMGRPIAVVRTSLKLELKGLPAIDHDWNRFRQDLDNLSNGTPRFTDNFTAVKFPIRLGDSRQLNDGLVGYWVETDGGFENDTFYSPQDGDNPSQHIQTSKSGKMNRHHAIDDPPETYTLLFDPRGVLHAHCGILPARVLSIPPDQYNTALKAIQVFFLSGPILIPTGQLTLPLPGEPGFSWSWLGRQNGVNWQETTTLAKPNLQVNFPAQQQIVEGWLKLRPDDQPPA